MKKIINKITIVLLMAFTLACVDESLDPVKFKEVKKATYLTLRGSAFDKLNDTGCSNSFFRDKMLSTDAFTFESDLTAEDQESLQEVQIFAELKASQKVTNRDRTLVTTLPGTDWVFPSGSTIKRGKISVPLASVIAALKLPADTVATKLGAADITISIDLVLKDGTKVFASAIVAPGLFASVIFQPAMVLTYCANDTDDFLPAASTKMLGEYKVVDKAIVRTVVPLKNGVKDTLYISYDQATVKTPPSVVFNPATAGTNGVVTPYKKEKNGFYVLYTAGGSYTGQVAASVTGATAIVAGVELTQAPKTQIINVDNTNPILLDKSTGNQFGVGQLVTIEVAFNEKLSTKSADAIVVSMDGSALGVVSIDKESMKLSSDGLSASLSYFFKLKNPPAKATHGDLTVTFTNAIDEAGNSLPISDGVLTIDVNAPPAPALTATGTYDLGTQIRWSASQGVDNTPVTGNSGGSDTGSVYFIAIPAGDPAPSSFSVDLDGVATWSEDDPASTTTPKALLELAGEQQGIVEVDGGDSGTTYTSFNANGTLDVYAVFVSSSGTISKISSTAPVVAPGTGNPLTITMN
jgi:hypothetical protein